MSAHFFARSLNDTILTYSVVGYTVDKSTRIAFKTNITNAAVPAFRQGCARGRLLSNKIAASLIWRRGSTIYSRYSVTVQFCGLLFALGHAHWATLVSSRFGLSRVSWRDPVRHPGLCTLYFRAQIRYSARLTELLKSSPREAVTLSKPDRTKLFLVGNVYVHVLYIPHVDVLPV